MAAAKKQTYIDAELDFLEKRLADLKNYLANNPVDGVGDRYGTKTIKGEEVDYVVATEESIIRCVRDSMKDYATLLDQIAKLRESEDKKVEARGGKNIPLLFDKTK